MRGWLTILLVIIALPTAAQANAGRVVSTSGRAEWQPGGGTGAWEQLLRGDQITEGSTVRTGPNSALRLLMADRSILSLGPSSALALSTYESSRARRKVSLKVSVGLLWARVSSLFGGHSQYDITTRTAVAGVRGTDLVVNVDESGATAVTCVSGRVRVGSGSGRPVFIVQNQRASVSSGGILRTSRVTSAQIRTLARHVRAGQLDRSQRDRRIRGATDTLNETMAPVVEQKAGGKGQNINDRLDAVLPDLDGTPPINLEPDSESGRLRGRIEVRDP